MLNLNIDLLTPSKHSSADFKDEEKKITSNIVQKIVVIFFENIY
tara:strand:- start:332 stop:463 length:132 start_codon:yes stop_codon:yes gene_type:complete